MSNIMFDDNPASDILFSIDLSTSFCPCDLSMGEMCEMNEVSSWTELWSDGPGLVIIVSSSSCMTPGKHGHAQWNSFILN